MGFKVVVKEGAMTPWDGNPCTPVRVTPEISDVYSDEHKFKVIDGRLNVFKKGDLVAVYQDWSRVIPMSDDKVSPKK